MTDGEKIMIITAPSVGVTGAIMAASGTEDPQLEAERQHIGKTLVSVTVTKDQHEPHQEYIRYTFTGGGYTEWARHIPVTEHKLAILVKALELAIENGNSWQLDATGVKGSHTINTWLKKSCKALSHPTNWKVLDKSINWPEWLKKEYQEEKEGD